MQVVIAHTKGVPPNLANIVRFGGVTASKEVGEKDAVFSEPREHGL
jgi:hypothetical protein